MRPRILVWAVLALAAATWLATRRGGSERPPAGAAPSPGTAADGLARETELALAPAPAARESGAASEPRAASTGPGSESEPALEVRVLEPGGGAAGGALVLLRDDRRARPPRRDGWLGVERRVEPDAERRVAGADGVARFAVPRGPATLVARRGDGFAWLVLSANEPGPVEVRLASDPAVRARVVDASGAPAAGVEVALRGAPAAVDRVRAATGADGIAELRAGDQRARLESAAFVGLCVFAREVVAAPVDLAAPPSEPIELALPPCGALEVELVDARGERWTRRATVVAGLAPATREELAGDAADAVRWLVRETEDGLARFEHVGLGLELQLDVSTDAREDEVEVVAGPRAAGERARARVTLARERPELAGRLVDPSGAPAGPAWLTTRVRAPDGDRSNDGLGQTFVDARGAFRATIGAPWGDGDGAERLELRLDGPDGAVRLASAPAPRLLPGVNDLGELALAPAPLVVSGVVRDEQGRPVRLAQVDVFADATEGARWSGERVDGARTDALGGFELRGTLDARVVGVQVQADGFAPFGPRVVPLGTAGVEVVLARGGTLVARVLSDSNWAPVLLVERDGRSAPALLRTSGRAHEYELGPLEPGAYSLRWRVPWSDAEGTVDGIVLRAGERALDPRLDPLDLRGLVPTVALVVVDPAGSEVPHVVVGLRERGEWRDCRPRSDGERRLVTAGPLPLAARVEAPGFLPRELELAGDARVVLERGPRVRLVVAGALPALPEGWGLEARLAREESSLASSAALLPLAGGVAEGWVSVPGRYALAWRVVQRLGGAPLEQASFGDGAHTVEVAPGGGTFDVPAPSPRDVAEILEFIDSCE